MAVIVAQGDVSGTSTLELTLTATPPTNSVLHVIHAAVGPGSGGPTVTTRPTDNKSGEWRDPGTEKVPILGAIAQSFGIGSPATRIQLGQTAIRVSGDPLVAGDTVTVTWADDSPGLLTIIAILIAFTEFNAITVEQYLGDPIPDNDVHKYYSYNAISSGNSIAWTDYYSVRDLPRPKEASKMVAACAAARPTIGPIVSGWDPIVGTKIAERVSADGSIALGIHMASIAALSAVDPGGTWSSGSSPALVGAYQFAEIPGCPPSVLWFFKDGQWRQQNVNVDYSLYFYKDGVWTRDCDSLTGFLENAWQV